MTLIEPDSFPDDWYGWLTNQASHIALGVFLSFFVSLLYWVTIGEMPSKMAALALIFVGYVGFEVLLQKWQGWDTVEDTVFTVGYGASAILMAFTEVAIGSPVVAVDIVSLAPFFIVASAHLVVGSLFRALR